MTVTYRLKENLLDRKQAVLQCGGEPFTSKREKGSYLICADTEGDRYGCVCLLEKKKEFPNQPTGIVREGGYHASFREHGGEKANRTKVYPDDPCNRQRIRMLGKGGRREKKRTAANSCESFDSCQSPN